ARPGRVIFEACALLRIGHVQLAREFRDVEWRVTGRKPGVHEQAARQFGRLEVTVVDLYPPGPEVGGVQIGLAVRRLGLCQALVARVGAVVTRALGPRGRRVLARGHADPGVPAVDPAVFRDEDEGRRTRVAGRVLHDEVVRVRVAVEHLAGRR